MMPVSQLQQHQAHGVLSKLCLSAIFLLLSQLGSSPALGQATYSDTWPDDSGVQSDTIYDEGAARSGPYAYGCGVTDGAYTHSYYVDVTETSPSGRNTFRSSLRRVGHARADVTLLWNWDDSGEYVTDTQHWARCPYDELSYYSLGFTQIRLLFGASINVMAHQTGTSNPSVYRQIPNCNVLCSVSGYVRPDYAGAFIWLIVPRGPFGCLKGSIVKRFASPMECVDIYSPVPFP